MKRLLNILILLTFTLFAKEPICSYEAKLSQKDHFNSRGDEIDKAYGVIMQDRANYYRFKKQDPQDSEDCIFKTQRARISIRKLFQKGKISNKTRKIILNSTPLVKIDVYKKYLKVQILDENEDSIENLEDEQDVEKSYYNKKSKAKANKKSKTSENEICYSFEPSKFIAQRINPIDSDRTLKKAKVNEFIIYLNKDYAKDIYVYVTLDKITFDKWLDYKDSKSIRRKKYINYTSKYDTGAIKLNTKNRSIKMDFLAFGDEEIDIIAKIKAKRANSVIKGKRVKCPNVRKNYLCKINMGISEDIYICRSFVDRCENYHRSFKTFGKGYKNGKEWEAAFIKCNK